MSNFGYCACGVEMTPHNFGCRFNLVDIGGTLYQRVKVDDPICGDCNAASGTFHHNLCDMERCPKCHGQMLSCSCDVRALAQSIIGDRLKKPREPPFGHDGLCDPR